MACCKGDSTILYCWSPPKIPHESIKILSFELRCQRIIFMLSLRIFYRRQPSLMRYSYFYLINIFRYDWIFKTHTCSVQTNSNHVWIHLAKVLYDRIFGKLILKFPFFTQSDVYSLGLILFELHQVFGTAMERVHCLGQARQGILPDSFTQSYPVHVSCVHEMYENLKLDRTRRVKLHV